MSIIINYYTKIIKKIENKKENKKLDNEYFR